MFSREKQAGTCPPPVNRPGRRSNLVRISSEGQRLLIKHGESLAVVADAVGCSRATVQNWRSGAKAPSLTARDRLFTELGIPQASWGVQPAGTARRAGQLESDTTSSTAEPTTLGACLELSAAIRQARLSKSLLPGERARLAHSEANVLTLRHRLECAAALSESWIIREHPLWPKVQRALSRVLAGCPRCSKAVLAELERLDR